MSLKRFSQAALGACAPTRRRAFGLCGALGLWLGFPNDIQGLGPVVLIWPLALAFLGFSASVPARAFVSGWLTSLLGSLAALYWLGYPVHDVGGLPWPAAIACAAFICCCLASQGGIFSLAACFLRKMPACQLALCLGLAWYLLEWAYAAALGFPWLPLAGALAPWPILIQPAELCGSYFLAGAWVAAVLLFMSAWPRFRGCGGNFSPVRMAWALVLMAAMLGYGQSRLESSPFEPWPTGQNSMAALFVEGNVEQNQKWVPAFQRQTLALYLDLTRKGLARAAETGMARPLIVWPETALPFFFERRPELALEVRQCARDAECPLLFGAPGLARLASLPEEAVFNRAFLLGPDGQTLGYYDKEHLVPFGESLPSWLNFSFLEALLQNVGIYQAGNDPRPLVHGRLALGMLICYEGVFPWLAGERVAAGANILVDISNDGWFGRSPASRQHLYLTALRCVEQNRWLLRGTNTGISAVVDSRGRIAMRGPQFQAGFILARAELLREFSFYHKAAPYIPAVAIAVLCFVIVLNVRSGRIPVAFVSNRK